MAREPQVKSHQTLLIAERRPGPMNKRRWQRKKVSNTKVELFDGSNNFEGVVKNVSNTGIETRLDSESIDPFAAKFDLRLSYEGKTYRISAIRRWQINDVEGSRMGLRIYEAPRDWSDFVDSFPSSVPVDNQLDS